MTFDKDFKEAISRLPSTEKDKLIFRLLKNDLYFANRLRFELLSTDGKEDRRKQVEKEIEDCVNSSKKHVKYSTPGILMMEMRDASGKINDHVYITKDKYGEVYLQILLLKEYLKIYNEYFKNPLAEKACTLNLYMVVKVFKIMILLKKMHEDLQFDFEDDLEETGRLFGDNAGLMKVAIHHGLDINWLIRNKIPENISEIEKDLRQRGYLK